MRLTLSLMKKVMPGGHIYIGKYRLEYKPDARARDILRTKLLIEEENMLYLRHPFLTARQSRGHALELGIRQKYKEQQQTLRKKWRDPVYLEDKLNHLRHGEKWDY